MTSITIVLLLLAVILYVAAQRADDPGKSHTLKITSLLFGAAAIIVVIYDLVSG